MAHDVSHSPSNSSESGRSRGSIFLARNTLRRATWLLAACTAVVVLICGWVGGAGIGLYQDEAYVAWLDGSGWGHIAEFIRYEPSPPFYHYVMKLWIDLGGESEAWLRAFSGLCYLATFPTIWWLGRGTFSRSERLGIFVLLVACKAMGFHATFVRFYELMLLESCVVLFAFIGLFGGRMPRGAALAMMALGNFAGLMTHYYFAFFMLAQGLTYLAFYRWRRLGDFVVGAVVPVIAFAVTWGPTFRFQLASGRFEDKKILPHLSELLRDTYFGSRWLLILPAFLLLILVEHRRGRWRPAAWGRIRAKVGHFLADPRVRMFALLWGVTFFSPFAASMVLGDKFLKVDPYIMLSTLPFVAVLVLAVDRSDRWLRVVVALVIVAAVGLIEGRSRTASGRYSFAEDGTRSAVGQVIREGQPGDIIVCLDNYFTKVDYYVRRTRPGPRPEILGFPKEIEQHPGWFEGRALKDMEAFRASAKDFAAGVALTLEGRPGCRVWVFNNDWVPQCSTVALEAFDGAMRRTGHIAVPAGVGYKEIVAFEPRRAELVDASRAEAR